MTRLQSRTKRYKSDSMQSKKIWGGLRFWKWNARYRPDMTGTVLTTMDLMSISKFLSVSPWIYIIINGSPKYEFLCEAKMIVVYEPSLMCFFLSKSDFFQPVTKIMLIRPSLQLCHKIAHLWSPRAENNLLPVGHKRENNPSLGSSATSSTSSVSVPFESSWSPFFWFSLVLCSSPLSSVPASAISPGFLSNSPLNCLRAFFSTSCSSNGQAARYELCMSISNCK